MSQPQRPLSPSENAQLEEASRSEKRPRLATPNASPRELADTAAIPESLEVELQDQTESQPATKAAAQQKQKQANGTKKNKKKKEKRKLPEPYTAEYVVAREVSELLGQEAVDKAVADGTEWDSPFQFKEEVTLTVSRISSTGDALAVVESPKPWVVIAPLALPGETIRARVYRNARLYSYADLLEVVQPNPDWRDMSIVKCKYFGKCAGCQYQMLTYEKQLELKRNVVVQAYQYFSELPETSVPPILSTIPSPLQYGYRTKITPHFEAPPKKFQKVVQAESAEIPTTRPDWLNIGFNQIGTRNVMDIEECPIATPVLNEALGPLRENIIKNIATYKKGVSLLLRDSLVVPPSESDLTSTQASPEVAINGGAAESSSPSSDSEKHICVTDHKGTVRELVGDKLFEYTAGSFFQNNNSVLVPLTSYVRDAISSRPSSSSLSAPTHLVDAYCGSGLFALSLAPAFERVAGIELSNESIRCATRNAELNGLSSKCTFLAGDAANIFATVQDFPREQTVLIIDPPRKGTDERFIEQLLEFACETVVYVSCNVHTQARDVGQILRKSEEGGGRKYVLESLRGFDLFPQTAHVESVAVLRLV